jgi:hypothetical protein
MEAMDESATGSVNLFSGALFRRCTSFEGLRARGTHPFGQLSRRRSAKSRPRALRLDPFSLMP